MHGDKILVSLIKFISLVLLLSLKFISLVLYLEEECKISFHGFIFIDLWLTVVVTQQVIAVFLQFDILMRLMSNVSLDIWPFLNLGIGIGIETGTDITSAIISTSVSPIDPKLIWVVT